MTYRRAIELVNEPGVTVDLAASGESFAATAAREWRARLDEMTRHAPGRRPTPTCGPRDELTGACRNRFHEAECAASLLTTIQRAGFAEPGSPEAESLWLAARREAEAAHERAASQINAVAAEHEARRAAKLVAESEAAERRRIGAERARDIASGNYERWISLR
jgi:hypothetical protein